MGKCFSISIDFPSLFRAIFPFALLQNLVAHDGNILFLFIFFPHIFDEKIPIKYNKWLKNTTFLKKYFVKLEISFRQ